MSGSSFQVRFYGGQSQAFQQLRIIDDTIHEQDEEFLVRLTSPIRGIVQEPLQDKVTILDDECKCSQTVYKMLTFKSIAKQL